MFAILPLNTKFYPIDPIEVANGLLFTVPPFAVNDGGTIVLLLPTINPLLFAPALLLNYYCYY